MTRELLNTIAKAHKINLEHFDEFISWVGAERKHVYIEFACRQNNGGNQLHLQRKTIRLSVRAIIRRGEIEWDYENGGWQFISDLM